MRLPAVLTVLTLTIAACDTFAPAAPDASRPSLFGPTPTSPAPASPAASYPDPAGAAGATQAGWTPGLVAAPRNDLSQPYPSQQQVLQQQQMQLNQGIGQQATSRDSLSQQLQQGAAQRQQETQSIQQMIQQDRARN